MKIYFKLILLLMLFSCQKLEDNKTENKEKFVLKEEDKRLIIDQYLVRLPEDSDFVKNFRLDRELSLLSGDSTGIASKADIEKISQGLKKIKTQDELIELWSNSNVPNGAEIIQKLIHKEKALVSVRKKFPLIQYLDKISLENLFKAAYQKVSENFATSNPHYPGCTTSCCDSYVVGMDGCMDTFTISTGLSVLSGAIVGYFTAGIAGYATFTAGMTAAELQYISCRNSAVANYRICMGYPPILAKRKSF
jgi:hypothetical protein